MKQMSVKKYAVAQSTRLKGIAILLMIFHHCFRNKKTYIGQHVSFFPLNETIVNNLSNMSKLCVSIFVFISGYGLYLGYKKNKESATRWVAKREIKLLSGYWIIFLITIIVGQFIDQKTQIFYFKKGIISGIAKLFVEFFGLTNLFGMKFYNNTWWYMSAAVVYVAMIPLIVKFKDNLLLLLAWVVILPRLFNIGYLSGTGAYSFMAPLILGAIFAEYDLMNRFVNWGNGSLKIKMLKFIAEISLLIMSYYAYKELSTDVYWEYHMAVYPIIAIVFFVEFIVDIPLVGKLLEFFGKHSANIFMIHSLIRWYWFYDFTYSFGNFIVIGAVLFVISLMVSIVLEAIKKLIGYDKMIDKLVKLI